ncbi:MAG: hypothetical protein EOO77_41470 [Oxalobacteraceae bacterium]|nr:MAG: hypothetical protein EOO77_41470 [Oxalobacteraceae bacterium]
MAERPSLGSIEPYQAVPGFQYFYTEDWPCGDRIFDASDTINLRLLKEGRLVWFCVPKQLPCTHVLTLVYGVWAHNNKPVHNRFAFRGSDEEAFLLAIEHGGRLEKACDFFRTVR